MHERRPHLAPPGAPAAPALRGWGGESVIYRASDGSYYEKRIDAKGAESEPICIDDEIPFDIPASWEWARIDSFASILNGDRGKNYPAKSTLKPEGIPFVSAINISNGKVVEEGLLCMTDAQYEALRAGLLVRGDYVFCIRGSLGKFGVFPFERGAIASSLVIVRSYLREWQNDGWLAQLLGSPLTRFQIELKDNGTAQPNLSAKDFATFLYPVPPLSEQRRIVERIEELMPLVEEYGKLEDEREIMDVELPERLRKSVLQMAVQGKLVAQDPADEPASALMERIREERRQLIAEKRLKATKGGESVIYRASDGGYYEKRVDAKGRESEPVCIDDEIPFDIPENWEWARLKSISSSIADGSHNPPPNSGCGIPILSAKNVYDNRLHIEEAVRWITEEQYEKEALRIKASVGSVLLTIVGTIGRTAVLQTRKPFALQRSVCVINPVACDSSYLALCLGSYSDYLTSISSGTAQKGVYLGAISDLLVPLPPLAEQYRIIVQIEELLPFLTSR